MKLSGPFIMLLWLFGVWVSPGISDARAQDDDRLFAVHGIEVDQSSKTATLARQLALTEARTRAWDRLIKKLVAVEDAGLLPPASDPLLEQLVRAVDIRDERSSATRYLAKVDVTFSADAVRDIFTQAGVSYTESAAGPYVLIPVFISGGVRHVYGDHPWRQALAGADRENRLIAYHFAENSFTARRFSSSHLLEEASPDKLGTVAHAFGVSKAVVATATMGFDYGKNRRKISYQIGIGPLTEAEADSMAARQGVVVAETDESLEALLARAADRVMTEADTAWKARTLVTAGQGQSLISVIAPVQSFEDWITLRNRLSGISLIRSLDITQIGLPLSEFKLRYIGDLEQLTLALSQARLSLQKRQQGYVLTRSEPTPEQQDHDMGANVQGNDLR
ncbi:hypothetical protein JCM17844_04000 [Iodidimonas gelatinilytica]|uniref:DUF2066 domain-containing protein n=1 Tax=Iodidimonas gelatinilytica TaxID=1236966 RepID=A0A5A7MNN9_9PROT|nr:DUF2066 domain-containing protein [Iodidimonas gelatinilytica]GEQ96763.1 hypothetical protein JCM17844_04000 [Iodidimonas gelatinilytica]